MLEFEQLLNVFFGDSGTKLQLTSRFLTDFYVLVGEWARWASGVVDTWPDDPRQAEPDPEAIAETLRRAAKGIGVS